MRLSLILLATLLATTVQAQTCNTSSIVATTPSSRFTVNGNGTATDKQTGLMWKQCLEGRSGESCYSGAPVNLGWDEALQVPAALNASGGFAGYTDWRLPNIKELLSIVERQCYDPALNLMVFPNEQQIRNVWSGSPYVDPSIDAWYVGFGGGGSNFGSNRVNDWSVRLVRVEH